MIGMTGDGATYDEKKLAIAQDAVKATPLVDGKEQAQNISEERKELVKELTEWVLDAKKHFAVDFKRMKWAQDFARGKQYPDQKSFEEEDRIIINIVQRHIKQVVAKLYAKNPTPVAKRAPQLDFAVWDENPSSLQAALATTQQAMALQSTGAVLAPQAAEQAMAGVAEAQALLADVQNGLAVKAARARLGKTLEIICKYYMRVQQPNFKRQMKQLVRRAATSKVAYIKLGFQRKLAGMVGEMETRLADANEQISYFETLKAELLSADANYDTSSCDGKLEEYRLIKQEIQKQAEVILQEGIVIDFPLATNIIPDPQCTAIDTWSGANRLVEQFILPPDEVKRRYGVDITDNFTAYTKDGKESKSKGTAGSKSKKKDVFACVWEVYDQHAGLVYPICHGYEDFLVPNGGDPKAPDVKVSEFFPIYGLVLNQMDHDEKLFPESDVELIANPQKEYNKKREAARQHRHANRPMYVAPKGSFGETDKMNLATAEAHEVLFLLGLKDGQDINQVISALEKIPMETALYATEPDVQDLLLAAGSQESDLGPTTGATATETDNAAASRDVVFSSNTDDIDDFLGAVFRGMGQIAMRELSEDTVKRIAGPGAIWAQFSEQEIMEDIWLETKGGSSGRPNASQDAAKLERVVPLLIQVPGITPSWLARVLVEIVDDTIDLSEAYTDGLPSIVSQNAMKVPGTGDPATDPASQGGKGGQNSPNNDQSRGAPTGMHQGGQSVAIGS